MVEQAKRAKQPEAEQIDLNAANLYVNRELSLLEFQQRVLAQADDPRHPLLERVKFLAIVDSNLDEFFMVRVSDLQDQLDEGLVTLLPDRMTPAQQLAAIRKRVVALYEEQRRILCEHLLPELADNGIRILDLNELTTNQRAGLRTYFEDAVFPVLTPLAVDPGHPFPHISNLSVNLAVELAGDGAETRFARVKIPGGVLPRLLHLEGILGQQSVGKRQKHTFVWLDQLIAANLSTLFPGVPVLASHGFRVIRDADIEIHEEEGTDLRLSVERGLRARRFGETVALQVEKTMPDHIRALLVERLGVKADEVYAVDPPLGVSDLMQLASIDRLDLKYPPRSEEHT